MEINQTRRRALQGLTGLFVAPAIVRADSLMKIRVPKQDLIVGRKLPEPGLWFFDELAFENTGLLNNQR